MNSMVNEVTLRFFQSLEIEKSLYEVFCYLESSFPLTNIHVAVLNRNEEFIHYLASATKSGGVLIDEKVKLTQSALFESEYMKPGKIIVLKDSIKSNIIKESVCTLMDKPESPKIFNEEEHFSSMTMAMDVGKPLVGICTMASIGRDMYTEELKDKFMSLYRPVNSALLNLLQHREIREINKRLLSENTLLQKRVGHPKLHGIIGVDEGLYEVMSKVKMVAKADTPVLITGETGTGKEVVANSIHQSSLRRNGPLISINCGAIPSSLVESELFGHEKGAFTGAATRKKGYFEQADNGTLFLDEIGDLPLSLQVKFLRVLQEKILYRVGGQDPVPVNTRVIAATHNDLSKMVKEKQFREDLWFRLNVFPIHIPPLRQRASDIPALVNYFIEKKAKEMHLDYLPKLSKGTMEKLQCYHWPGNIRELENCIERELILSGGKPLVFSDMNPESATYEKTVTDEIEYLDKVIKDHIKKALKVCGGKVAGKGGAAEKLGIHKSTLWGKIRKYNIKHRI